MIKRILVAIANHGTGNRQYLDRLIREYRSMPWRVDIVVLSNIPKDLGPGVEVRVGLPTKDPWSLPFGHRRLFADRQHDYDLFIYSEDDTLVRQRSIEAFLEVTPLLRGDEVAGFLRTEEDSQGNVYYSSVHSYFRWDAQTIRRRGSDVFARFTNEHAACYILAQQQLGRAIASGGFLVEPHEGRHDMLCAAATDPYTQCGMKKLICISRLDDFTLPHLPNKYIGRMGIPREDMLCQVEALRQFASRCSWHGPLLNIETKLPGGRWSKHCYEQPDERIVAMVPANADAVLSIGCGWGETERVLVERGQRVLACPVDPILGESARSRGVEIVEGDLEDVWAQLEGQQFGCVILPDVLHLVADPVGLLRQTSTLLADGACLVASIPNVGDAATRWRRMNSPLSYDHDGLQWTNTRSVRSWLNSSGFHVDRIDKVVSGAKRFRLSRAARGMFDSLLATRLIVRATSESTRSCPGRAPLVVQS